MQTGVNALRLAIQLMASPRMVEILSPPDFPDSWERLCGNPPINALQLAQFMCAHNQGDVLAYYKVACLDLPAPPLHQLPVALSSFWI